MSPQQTIAHYRTAAKFGHGGRGEVWRATDTKLNRELAIKVLSKRSGRNPIVWPASPEAQVLPSLRERTNARDK
jgi:serine/threonine protein kinase